MKLTEEQKEQIRKFNFRYAEKVEGNIYRIQQAKKLFPNPSNPHVLDNERICFWHDDCEDHACCISVKNILFN